MKFAMIFPGQGSQSVGMMAGYDAHPAVRKTFAEASEALAQDLWTLAAAGPDLHGLEDEIGVESGDETGDFILWENRDVGVVKRTGQLARDRPDGPGLTVQAGHRDNTAQRFLARYQVGRLRGALEVYRLEKGEYPCCELAQR